MIVLLILNLMFFAQNPHAEDEVVVIVNKAVPDSTMDATTLSKIYKLQKKRWDDGTDIVVLNLKSDRHIKDKFYRFIGVELIYLRKLWLRYELTGEATPPKAFKTEMEILKFVATTPGAIGYIKAATATDDVKIVLKI